MTEQQIIETLGTEVMGWRIDKPYWSKKTVWVKSSTQYDWIENWNPLENLSDAFQVVDKLLSHFYIFELVGCEGGWVAIFKLEDGNFNYPKMFEGAGKTREKAICKAAMKVVEM